MAGHASFDLVSSCRVLSCLVASGCVVLCRVVRSCLVLSYHLMSSQLTSCVFPSRRVSSYRVVSYPSLLSTSLMLVHSACLSAESYKHKTAASPTRLRKPPDSMANGRITPNKTACLKCVRPPSVLITTANSSVCRHRLGQVPQLAHALRRCHREKKRKLHRKILQKLAIQKKGLQKIRQSQIYIFLSFLLSSISFLFCLSVSFLMPISLLISLALLSLLNDNGNVCVLYDVVDVDVVLLSCCVMCCGWAVRVVVVVAVAVCVRVSFLLALKKRSRVKIQNTPKTLPCVPSKRPWNPYSHLATLSSHPVQGQV